jgi:hypothetical protein
MNTAASNYNKRSHFFVVVLFPRHFQTNKTREGRNFSHPPYQSKPPTSAVKKHSTDLLINSATKLCNYEAHQSKFVYPVDVAVDTGEAESRFHYNPVFTTYYV